MDQLLDDSGMQSISAYANPLKRFVALIIDAIILGVVFGIVASLFGMSMFVGMDAAIDPTTGEMNPGAMGGMMAGMAGLYGGSILLNWLYYALMESSSHQATLGKKAMGLIVTDMNGNRISFLRATGRFFGKIVSALIIYIGFIMAFFTQKKQGLHDMMASCLVLDSKR